MDEQPTVEELKKLTAGKIGKLATDISDELDARIILYNGTINYKGWFDLLNILGEKTSPNILFILTTNGGDANAAYQICRTLQEHSDELILLIPYFCKSAGTLISLGATHVVMSGVAEIGPLDVQLRERDEIGGMRSGLVSKTALEGLADETYEVFESVLINIKDFSDYQVGFEMAANIATKITGQVMAPIYGQIDPDNLGRDLRNLRIATEYGERLATYGGNVQPDTVRKLVEDYPSHDFVIDPQEASGLFVSIEPPSSDMSQLCLLLGEEVFAAQNPPIIKRLDEQKGEDDGQKTQEKDNQSRKTSRKNSENEKTPTKAKSSNSTN